MGVHGLWKLVDSAGKPVPVESLENKVLAIDISLWLHQSIKGFRDSKGAPVLNSHLLGIYHRLCKLLYFKVKPVFVFDGGVPTLKKQTVAKRNQSKLKAISESNKLQSRLINTIIKYSAVDKVLNEKVEEKNGNEYKEDHVYSLSDNCPLHLKSPEPCSSINDSSDSDSSPSRYLDLHSVDVHSSNFKSLPVNLRHEILTDLKETRKQSSWGRIHELPKESGQFSTYQVDRLLKRQAVQAALDEVENEIGSRPLSLLEMETLLKEQGVIKDEDVASRIASDESKKFVLVKDLKKALESEKQKNLPYRNETVNPEIKSPHCNNLNNTTDTEYEAELEKAIILSLKDEYLASAKLESNQQNAKQFFLTDDTFNSNKDTQQHAVSDTIPNSSSNTKLIDSNCYEFIQTTDSSFLDLPVLNISSQNSQENSNDVSKLEIDESEESSTNSSDFEEIPDKYVVNVSIDPNLSFENEDDLFKDVFDNIPKDFQSDKNCDDTESKLDNIHDVADSFDNNDIDLNYLTKSPNLKEPLTKEHDLEKTTIYEHHFNSEMSFTESKNNETSQSECVITDNILEVTETKEKPIREHELIESHKSNEMVQKKQTILKEQELIELQDDLRKQKFNLLESKSNQDRLASNITDQMYQEAQELLELFGVPYIIAPMEAEAQCAYIEELNLTDGTITDDSDIWLFGAKTVYKNFFKQNKYVMEFRAENIEHHFKLTRQHMILLALLVGSDYTDGLQGVGPVTAMEILAAFPSLKEKINNVNLSNADLLSGLKEFKAWFTKVQSSGPKRACLRNKLKNLVFSNNFPSIQVVQAYLDPSVDKSNTPFSWSKPNLLALIEFAQQKFGWTKQKTEDILNPVMKRLEERNFQKSIKDYFKTSSNVQYIDNVMSKRVKSAVSDMDNYYSQSTDKGVKNCSEKLSTIQGENIKGSSKRIEQRKNRKKQRKSDDEICRESDFQGCIPKEITKNSKKVNLEKLKIFEDRNAVPSTSRENVKNSNPDECTVKINNIIRRRKLNEVNSVIKTKKTKTECIKHLNVLRSVTVSSSQQPVEQKNKEKVHPQIDFTENKYNVASNYMVHVKPKKEVITQVENDKMIMFRNKLKAIETFRKSKHGPGYVGKMKRKKPLNKIEINLSENSSSSSE